MGRKQPQQPIISCIMVHTPPPRTLSQARKYPDAQLWAKKKIRTWTSRWKAAIRWFPNHLIPPRARIILLKMGHRLKKDHKTNKIHRKARCSVRGDLKRPEDHYDSQERAKFVTELSVLRLIYAIAASWNLFLKHIDFRAGFFHEWFKHKNPVYIYQFPRFDGSIKHPYCAVQLVGNIYNTRQGG